MLRKLINNNTTVSQVIAMPLQGHWFLKPLQSKPYVPLLNPFIKSCNFSVLITIALCTMC